jgi:GT2 family glycosyltransferase
VRVAVAVVSWNTRDLLAAALRSLKPEADAGRAEIWVVDNASTDGSAEMVREEFPWVELVASEDNLGFGPAVNLVARRTDAEWIAPANADIELEPGALETLLATGAAEPRAGIVAPRLVLPSGDTQHSVHPFPTFRLALAFNLGLHRLSRRLGDRLTLEGTWDERRARVVDWAIGAFMIVRRDAFDAAGGFDDAQWMYAEDLDLGWRIRHAGFTTRFEPGAAVKHVSSAAATQAFGDEIVARWMAASYGWMARRRGVTRTWAVAAVNWLGAAVRYAFARPLAKLAPERWAPACAQHRQWLAAHRSGLRSRRELLGAR